MLDYSLRKNNQVRNAIQYAKPLPSSQSIAVSHCTGRNYNKSSKKTDMNKDGKMGVVKKKSKKKKTNVEEKAQRKCNKLFKCIRGYSIELSSSCF